jgi:hypothetical protein
MTDKYTFSIIEPYKSSPNIRYFKLTEEMFSEDLEQEDLEQEDLDPAGTEPKEAAEPTPGSADPDSPKRVFQVEIHSVSINPAGYITRSEALKELDLAMNDTTVLNFQVGTGKTTVLYDIIEEYIRMGEEYTIFYCAPFLRLISEVKSALKKKGITCFDCVSITGDTDASTLSAPKNLDARVQLMTPDFLLGRGGESATKQLSQKREYKVELRRRIEAENRRVILILDEIHENTAVFNSHRMPHLLQWRGLIKKVFIASATFTYDSVQVTRAVSFLTDQRIGVFQADRVKNKIQARLHLHVCAQPYGKGKDLVYLAGLARVVQSGKGRPLHILTAYKSIANELYRGGETYPAKTLKECYPKIKRLTSDNKAPFDDASSSLGTTFKTGVNINSRKGLLIVVLPGMVREQIGNQSLGTFTDMRSSVIQGFARLRNGGDIHVFMPPFSTYIRNEHESGGFNPRSILHELIKELGFGSGENAGTYLDEVQLLGQFRKLYHERRSELNNFKEKLTPSAAAVYDKQVGFGRMYDFILEDYPYFKDATLENEGQGLPQLIYWMAANNQFTNCTLETITVERYGSTGTKSGKTKSASYAEVLGEKLREGYVKSTGGAMSVHEAIEEALEFFDREYATDAAFQAALNCLVVKNHTPAPPRNLYGTHKSFTSAVVEAATELAGASSTPRKKLFEQFIHTARAYATPSSVEGCYADVQQQLGACRQEILDASANDAKYLYLRTPFDEYLSSSAFRDAYASLVTAIGKVVATDPTLCTKVVALPGFSKEYRVLSDEQRNDRVAQYLLKAEFGLITFKGKNNNGKDSRYGKGVPYKRIPLDRLRK